MSDKTECVIAWACVAMLIMIGLAMGFALGCMHKNREIEQIQTENINAMKAENAKWRDFLNEDE